MWFAATIKEEEVVHPQEDHQILIFVDVKPVFRTHLHQNERNRANPQNTNVNDQNVSDSFKSIRFVLLPLRTTTKNASYTSTRGGTK